MNINSCHILLKNVLFFAHHGVAPQAVSYTHLTLPTTERV